MFHSSPARWLAALPAIVALSAIAQTAPAPSSTPQSDPPDLPFRSAFEGYKPYADEKAIPWKEANETVYQRGGWRAYAKDASEEGAGENAPPKPGADPHAGHSMPAPMKKEKP
ncbi:MULTISPECIES: hypothetical protein [unclassified Variovorax]|uniref:hypothetical protein n=1 Tax=unclassified Variovorax TaxID=663243 RepID=UPI00076D133A|nr:MULTISPECIES: hypothetical protein [unclassified Variovorax]KWT97258.1 hypothetical protein APY03_1698 [Variovorax sp. WDL1]PNG48958.1 hypothetical protein CHC07_06600 [Variovorax sp. B4]PNG49764.1 hypothetical protein CHC06_05345 [Variovorax sp. B2]VTV18524.1 hypothetical protein WDL1P2_00221 [Variovorax sp. WDL1]